MKRWRCCLRWRMRSICAARSTRCLAASKINVTENRAVLHTALRQPRDAEVVVDGDNVVPGVHEVLDRMAVFANAVRSGELDRRHRGSGSGTWSISASAGRTSGR